jgi:transcriptional regulator with GAF, ATPase, and Fis domain
VDVGGFRMLVPREHRGEVDEYLQSVPTGTGPATRLVVPFLTKNGEEKIFSWTYSLISGEETGAEKAVMIGQDVTERVKARLEVERRARELEIVNRILRKAGDAVAVEEILDETLNAVMELPGYRCGIAYLLGEGDEAERRLSMLGFARSMPPRTIKWVEGVFPATALFSGGVEAAWPDTEMHSQVREILSREGLRGIIAVPLVPAGQHLGMLLLGHDFDARQVEEDRSIMLAVAEAFNLGAENLLFRARAEERAREATAMYRVARSMTEEVALERTLEGIVSEATRLFEADMCGILLYDEETGLLTCRAAEGADIVSAEVPLEDSGTAALAAKTLKRVIVDDAEADRRVPRCIVEEHGVKSSLVVPLIVDGKFAGAMFIDMRKKRRYSATHRFWMG